MQDRHLDGAKAPSTMVTLYSFSSEQLSFPQSDHAQGVKLWGRELSRTSKMALPLFCQNLLGYSTSVVAVAFIGHLNDPSLLSSAVLANSLYNVTGYSVIQGLSAGMETLCGQAFGARSYKALGVVLQRALLITWLMCIPIALMWAHMEPILLAVGQQPKIAAGAAGYLWHIMPTLFMGAVVECLKRYLLAQQVVLPGMVITIVTSMLCPLYNWLLVFRYQYGLTGAAYAFVLSQATSCVLLILYTAWRDAVMAAAHDPEATWSQPGWGMWQGWGRYMSYGVPACLMICMEWWCYEVLILLAGVTHNAELAVGVMGLCLQISAMAYMASMAYSSAVNTRVGNELGAGNAAAAKLSYKTAVSTVVVLESFIAVGAYLGGKQVVGLLTNNMEVEQLTLQVFPLLVSTFVGDSINAVCMATLRGAGRQGWGACINAVGYWCFGVPLSALFGLKLQMSVKGFWLGLLCTTYGMSTFQLILIARFDWQREVERAAALMAEHEKEEADAKAALLTAAAGAAPRSQGVSDTLDAVPNRADWGRPAHKRHSIDRSNGRLALGPQQQADDDDRDQEQVSLLAGSNSSSGKVVTADEAALQWSNTTTRRQVSIGNDTLHQQQQQQSMMHNWLRRSQDLPAEAAVIEVPSTSGETHEQSPLLLGGVQPPQMQQQASLQRHLLKSCDSIDR